MTDSFLRSPVQAAVSAEMGRIEARRSARAAPPAPVDPRGMFEQASEQYQVPANLLMALGEASGLDPQEFATKSGQLAEALGKSISSGRKHSEAIREVLPGAPAGFETQVVDRSNALYDELYAPQEESEPEAPNDGGFGVTDAAVRVASSLNRAGGSALRMAGEAAATLGDYTTTPLAEAITGEDYGPTPNALAPVADAIQGFADQGAAAISAESLEAIKNSSPSGDLSRPSTWKLGDAPSMRGYAMLASDVFGSMLPVVIASVATGGTATPALVGGLTGGGAGAEQAAQVIEQMAEDKGPDGRSRIESNPYYRTLVDGGMSPERALRRTKMAAARLGGWMTMPVSMFGGAATGAIVNPATKIAASGPLAARIAGRGALSAVEEGAQEVAESVAARTGANLAVGADENVMDGTFGDFLLGMLGGGATGAGAGVATRPLASPTRMDKPEAVPEPEEEAPRALPSPTGGGTVFASGPMPPPPTPGDPAPLALPSPTAGGTVIPPAPPAGPISAAIQKAPPRLAPASQPGDRLTVEAEGIPPFEVTLLGEAPGGLRVRDSDGQELEIPREEMDAGTTRILPAGAPVAATDAVAIAATPVVESESTATPVDVPNPALDAQQAPAPGSESDPVAPLLDAPAPAAEPAAAPSGLADAAAQAVQPPAPRTDPAQAEQLDLLAKRLAIINDQARTSGWNKRLTALRDKTQAAIVALSPAPIEPPAEVPAVVPAPAPAKSSAPKSAQNMREAVSDGKDATIPGEKINMPTAPEITQIREKAGRLTGVDQARADQLATDLKIKLPADGKGGFTFSWKHAEKLRKAVGDAAPSAKAPSWWDDASPDERLSIAITAGIIEAKGKAWADLDDDARQELAAAKVKVDENEKPPAKTAMPARRPSPPQIEPLAGMSPMGRMPEAKGWPDHPTEVKRRAARLWGASDAYQRTLLLTEAGRDPIPDRAAHTRWSGLDKETKDVLVAHLGRDPKSTEIDPLTGVSSKRVTPAAQEIAAAAAEAAPEPTEGQKEAGNYRMGHVKVHGLDVSIENAKGSTRRGTAPDGKEWSVEMPAHYGYIRRTEGADGDHVDVYIGENPESDRAFIIDQFDPKTGKLDEHKTVLGARTEDEALAIYDGGFSDGSGPARRQNMAPTEMSVDEFKAWLHKGDQTKPAQDTEGEKAPAPAAAPQAEPTGQDAPAAPAGEARASPATKTQNPEPESQITETAPPEPEDEGVRISSTSQAGEKIRTDDAQPREPDGRFASPETEVEPGRLIDGDGSAFSISYEPPKMGFRDAGALRGHLTRGALGEVVGKLIDAGKVVLYETEETLPEAGGNLSAAILPPNAPTKNLDVLVDAVEPGKVGRAPIVVGSTPDALLLAGAPTKMLVVTQGTIGKAMAKHGMSHDQIKAALRALYDPVMVMDSADAAHAPDGSLVAVVDVVVDGKPVVVAIHVARSGGEGRAAINEIKTMGGRGTGQIQRWLDEGNLKVWGRKAGSWAARSRLQLPRGGFKNRLGFKVVNLAKAVKNDEPKASRAPLPVITATGEPIRDKVQATRKLRNLGMDPTTFDLQETPDGFIATPKETSPAGPVQGMTTPDGVIHLVARNLTARTAMPVLLHEAFHAGAEPMVGEAAWRGLIGRLETALRAAEGRRRSGDRIASDADFWDAALRRIDAANVPPEQRAEEFGAYAIEEAEKAPPRIRGFIDRLIGKVKDFLLRRFGIQFGEVTPAQLRSLAAAALRSGLPSVGRKAGTFLSIASGSMVAPNIPSLTAEQMAEMDRGVISSALTKAMEGGAGGKISILGLVPGRPLFAELSKKMSGAQEYLALKTEMDALRNQWHARTDETAQAWKKLVAKDGAANAKLMDIMHEATLLGADPSKPYQSTLSDRDRLVLSLPSRGKAYQIAAAAQAKDASRQAEWAKLRKRLRALPAEFQAMFEKVRDEYSALNTAFDAAIIENAGRAIDAALRKAERAHEEEMARIRDEGLAGKERAEAVAEADRRLASTKYRVRANRRARMADLRAEFETKTVPAPYFPLARFGSFFVTTRDAETGAVLGFSTFESPKAQQAFVKEQAADPAHKVEAGTLGETSVRDMVDPSFVQAVEKILIDANMPEAILDAIWQQWLQTMPDLSLRKKRIHRKGTPGFSSDAFRAFGHHMFHGSHQLARLRYAIELAEALEIAGAQAKAQPDPVRAGLIVEEMKRRHEFTMNPKGAWWSQAVTSAAFIWYLAMSPAAAIVNLSQTTIMGPPILGAAFPEAGVRGAARELTRALHDFSRGLATWRPGKDPDDAGTVGASGRLSAEEQAAMEEAYRRGTVDKSQAHDLAGVGETGVEYSATRARIMGVVSWAFHHTERLNREVTFLAAYRMARKSGLDHHDAIDRASDVTWRTHFDYQGSSRPRVMQGDAAKVLLLFRNFQVNMLYRLVRDVHQSINAKDKEERREALTQLAGITGMLFLNGGVRGVWGFGLAMSIIGMFFAGGSDDAEDELKKAIVGALGAELGGMVLNGVPGHLTGTDLTSRVGMPDLWFRSSDRIVEGEDAYNYWLGEFLGAGFGMAERAFRGGDLLMKGEFQRGIETLLPKGLRDLARAARFGMEGVTTMKGDEIVPDVAVGEVLRQALGFTPARVAERYAANSKMKNAETRIMDERQGIMAEVAAAVKGGGALPDRLIGRIEAFNRAHPTYPITMDSLRTSLRSRARSSARMEFGILLNPRLNDEIRGRAAPLVYE